MMNYKKLICIPLAFIMWGCATQKKVEHKHVWVIQGKQDVGGFYLFSYKCYCGQTQTTYTPNNFF